MAERLHPFDGKNAALAALLAVVTLGALGLVLGPAISRWSRAENTLDEQRGLLESWNEERLRSHQVTEVERLRWKRQWELFVSRIPRGGDGPERIARLAEAVQGPSVRQLEIDRVPLRAESLELVRMPVESPLSNDSEILEGDPMRIRFTADYEHVKRLLGDFEAGALPARLETLTLQRRYPHVAVDMTLTVFARREVES